MAVSGDVTIAQSGGHGNIKLHPYLMALARWCVSCLWSTATIVIHRLVTGPLQPITATKPRSRGVSTEHLHPEPRVECVVLHRPADHNCDVIFIHGLYGSLGNTWRQGDWHTKYKKPKKTPLRRPTSLPTLNCDRCEKYNGYAKTDEQTYKQTNIDSNINNKILHNNSESDIFYGSKKFSDRFDLMDRYQNNEEILSDFLNELNCCDENDITLDNLEENLKKYCDKNDITIHDFKREKQAVLNGTVLECSELECKCKKCGKGCEVGCGCVCRECYSECWPRDWIRVDHPGARIISVNYTSDPYLWRPIWVKENKRLNLYERAEQMTQQLLDLGVGQKPIIWVGHSKGGLFIKQIYCNAYENYLTLNSDSSIDLHNFPANAQSGNNINNNLEQEIDKNEKTEKDIPKTDAILETIHCNLEINNNNKNGSKNENESERRTIFDLIVEETESFNENNNLDGKLEGEVALSSERDEDSKYSSEARSRLWRNSCGFMFYSVPHRGSPLADIKTPITARSIELLEISKDCSLVLSLQERWLRATTSSRPVVRSLVETCRTLMSVLWLRIVSVDSADPGVGAVCGVSVDHREICKPSSRRCPLYAELMTLMRAALNKCQCQ